MLVFLAQMELSASGEAGGCRLPCSPGGEGCTAGAYKKKISLSRSTTAVGKVDVNKPRAQGCS